MSNEKDLDWLARNVNVWPEGKNFICYSRDHGYAIFYEHDKNCANWFTKDQWLARRAELQNKPSFADHPDAKCFFQHENGVWSKNIESHDMGIDAIGWRNKYQSLRADYGWLDVGKGEVLGDWRDTLEKRPSELQVCKAKVVGSDKVIECDVTYEVSGNKVIMHGTDMSEQAVTEIIQELPAVTPEFKPSIEDANRLAQEFKLFTSIEDSQEQDMQQDNGWFERGELPSVGERCVLHTAENNGEQVMFIGVTSDGHPIFETVQKRVFVERGEYKFTPIRTERELAIDRMQSDIAERWANCEELAKHLVDKGWVKESK